MRILIPVHDFALGGTERIAIRLADAWSRAGHEVIIACGLNEGPLAALIAPAVQVVAAPFPIRRSSSRLPLGRWIAKLSKALRPDVIFLPGNYYFAVATIVKLTLPKPPRIVGKMSNAVVRSGKGKMRTALRSAALGFKARRLDGVVITLPAFRSEVVERLRVEEDRVAIIPQPVLDDPPVPSASDCHCRDGLLLIAAGRLQKQKNFELLLKAHARLAPQTRLTILGDGPLKDELASLAAALGTSGRVSFEGYVPDVQSRLRQARLFILSSDYEGFGTVIIEAFDAGLQVVATNCSASVKALISDSRFGEVVEPGDADALAAAIANLLAGPPPDPDLLKSAAADFRLGPAAALYLNLFERLQRRPD